MTSYAFAVRWLKAFRRDPEEVAALYADEFLFEDPILDQLQITDKPTLIRAFSLFANADTTNGIGIQNIRVRSFQGDARSAFIRWEWGPEHADNFLGVDIKDRPFLTHGRSFQIYDAAGKIVRESAWWDATAWLVGVGYPDVKKDLLAKVCQTVPATTY